MPHPAIERLLSAVEEDSRLRDELWAITEPAQFVSQAVRCAGERGILLVDTDVWEAFNAGRLSWLATQMP